MIELSRLNGSAFFLNSDLIRAIEQTPDTLITLTNGEKLMVKESPQEIANRVAQFRNAVAKGVALLGRGPRPPEDCL